MDPQPGRLHIQHRQSCIELSNLLAKLDCMKSIFASFTVVCSLLLGSCERGNENPQTQTLHEKAPDTRVVEAQSNRTPDEIAYWDTAQRKGANAFGNKPPSQSYFDAFADYGGEWMRLTWSKWDSASGDTFLIGDPSNYDGLVEDDVAVLKDVVARAKNSGIKLVFTPLTLPGSVWGQHNGDKIDDRLYSDKIYWEQSAAFWRDLADVFKDDPTVIAYNIVNEPTPERPTGHESGTPDKNRAWYQEQIGTARDLPAFYDYVIDAIREVDENTPIMIDGGFYGNPNGFDYFPSPLKDDKVLYSFHMYQPWAATSVWNIRNGSKLVYPGEMEIWGKTEVWDAERIQATIETPINWAETHGIDRARIVMGEFGCHRYLTWCATYLEDVLSAADTHNLHWAFYTFRSDSWGGMDYELGGERPSKRSMGVTAETFWELSEQNRLDEISRSNTELFQPISRRLKQTQTRE